jgi:hypothetical protein
LHRPHIDIFGVFSDGGITILQKVSHLLLGLNRGRAMDNIALPESAKAFSSEHDFDLKVGIYPACCYDGLESV